MTLEEIKKAAEAVAKLVEEVKARRALDEALKDAVAQLKPIE